MIMQIMIDLSQILLWPTTSLKIRKIAVYRFLISLLVPELLDSAADVFKKDTC